MYLLFYSPLACELHYFNLAISTCSFPGSKCHGLKSSNCWHYCQTMEIRYFLVVFFQTQAHAASGNTTMLYELFTTYKMLFLTKYSPFKKKLNFVTGDDDLANGDYIAVL